MDTKHQDTEPEINTVVPFEHVDELNKNAWDIRRSDLRASWKLANDAERFSILNPYQKGLAQSLIMQPGKSRIPHPTTHL